MDHNEIAAICRQLLVKTLNVVEADIPSDPWDKIIFDFANDRQKQDFSVERLEYVFGEIIKITQEKRRGLVSRELALQVHHDYYVKLFNESEGNLSEFDMLQYQKAKMREAEKLCAPLSSTTES